MVILCRHDGPHRQQAIAARLAVDDNGLAPFLLQRVGDQPRSGVRSGARTERQHEAHRMRGPLLGEACRRGDGVHRQRERGDHGETKPTVVHDPSRDVRTWCPAAHAGDAAGAIRRDLDRRKPDCPVRRCLPAPTRYETARVHHTFRRRGHCVAASASRSSRQCGGRVPAKPMRTRIVYLCESTRHKT